MSTLTCTKSNNATKPALVEIVKVCVGSVSTMSGRWNKNVTVHLACGHSKWMGSREPKTGSKTACEWCRV